MKIKSLLIALVAIIIGFSACSNGTAKTEGKIKTNVDTVAYSLGISVGNSLKVNFSNVDAKLVAQGLIDAFEGKENKLFTSEEEADFAIRTFLNKQRDIKAQETKVKGEEFLANNAKKAGVQVTASGLQYEIIKQGTGPKPKLENTVKVHYHGTTIDGEVFQSTVEANEPVSFGLSDVISGWTEGLQLMPEGSKFRFFIPSDLAYGERGAGQAIPPHSTLIFEVELLEIEK